MTLHTLTQTKRFKAAYSEISETVDFFFAGERVEGYSYEPSLAETGELLEEIDRLTEERGERAPRAAELRAILDALQCINTWIETAPSDLARYGKTDATF